MSCQAACAVDGEVVEEGLHGDADLFVVAVGSGPARRSGPAVGAAETGQDGSDDVIAQGDETGDGPCGVGWDVVAVGAADLGDEVLGAQLAQVVGGLTDGVVVVGLIGHRVHLGGEVTGVLVHGSS